MIKARHDVLALGGLEIADPAHRNGVLSAMYLVKDTIIRTFARRKLPFVALESRAGFA